MQRDCGLQYRMSPKCPPTAAHESSRDSVPIYCKQEFTSKIQRDAVETSRSSGYLRAEGATMAGGRRDSRTGWGTMAGLEQTCLTSNTFARSEEKCQK